MPCNCAARLLSLLHLRLVGRFRPPPPWKGVSAPLFGRAFPPPVKGRAFPPPAAVLAALPSSQRRVPRRPVSVLERADTASLATVDGSQIHVHAVPGAPLWASLLANPPLASHGWALKAAVKIKLSESGDVVKQLLLFFWRVISERSYRPQQWQYSGLFLAKDLCDRCEPK